jgi:hypothetical protein
MVLVSDNFDRSDGPLGSNWAYFTFNGFLADSGIVIGTNEVSGITGGGCAAYSAAAFRPNQFSGITYSTRVINSLVGTGVRISSAGGYLFVVTGQSAGGTIYKLMDPGTGFDLFVLATCDGPVPGQNFALRAIGSRIMAVVGNTVVASATDNTFSTGAPGIVAFSSGSSMDNWTGGELSSARLVVKHA